MTNKQAWVEWDYDVETTKIYASLGKVWLKGASLEQVTQFYTKFQNAKTS